VVVGVPQAHDGFRLTYGTVTPGKDGRSNGMVRVGRLMRRSGAFEKGYTLAIPCNPCKRLYGAACGFGWVVKVRHVHLASQQSGPLSGSPMDVTS